MATNLLLFACRQSSCAKNQEWSILIAICVMKTMEFGDENRGIRWRLLVRIGIWSQIWGMAMQEVRLPLW